jgi:RND family efflux transporter MFP subunit
VVAERYAEQGDTVSANTPLLAIIELDPIRAVIFVTERDYALLEAGQAVRLETDAYPGRVWRGEVARVAPVFREGSRQARVEIRVENADAALKPGMFVRVETVLARVADATLVPAKALVRRAERDLVFVMEGEGAVRAVEISLGIRDGETQQVEGAGLTGRVVTLGQQLLEDGSAVRVVDADGADVTVAGDGGAEGDSDG